MRAFYHKKYFLIGSTKSCETRRVRVLLHFLFVAAAIKLQSHRVDLGGSNPLRPESGNSSSKTARRLFPSAKLATTNHHHRRRHRSQFYYHH